MCLGKYPCTDYVEVLLTRVDNNLKGKQNFGYDWIVFHSFKSVNFTFIVQVPC